MVLNSDDPLFGGQGRSASDVVYPKLSEGMYGRAQSVQIYLPSRSVQVLAPVDLAGG